MYGELRHLPGAAFSMGSSDPCFRVERRGRASFQLSGRVSEAPHTAVAVGFPSREGLEVLVPVRSGPREAVATVRGALPRGIVLTERSKGTEQSVEVRLHEAVLPAAGLPRLRAMSSDLAQEVLQRDENKLEFRGTVAADGHLSVLCDGRRLTLPLSRGQSARLTAVRLGAALPHGYQGLVEGATVSVWKDADLFRAVA